MKSLISAVAALALSPLSQGVQAVEVQNLTLDGFSFQVESQGGASSAVITEATPNAVIAPTAGADLAGASPGSGQALMTFPLTDPLNRGSGIVSMFTNAVAPASIDAANNTLTLDLSSFRFTWNTGSAPSLCTLKACDQPQALGPVTGSWNPATHAFSMSWDYFWHGDTVGEDHPWPDGMSYWTLNGSAAPVPEPSAWALLLVGLGLLGGSGAWTRRQR